MILIILIVLLAVIIWWFWHKLKIEEERKKLFSAAEEGDVNMIKALIKKGVDVNATDEDGWSPLHMAAAKDHSEVIKVLLSHGADVNAKNKWGRTPLHMAAANDCSEVAKLLISHGGDVNARDKDGKSPLHFAAEYGGNKVAELLLSHGADVNARNKDGWTPLDVAKKFPRHKLVSILESHGGKCLVLCLFKAIEKGHIQRIKALLSDGADINAKTPDGFNCCGRVVPTGCTPLHAAVLAGHREVVEFLISHGANVNAKNKDGWTPLDIAKLYFQDNLIPLLESHGGVCNICLLEAVEKGDIHKIKTLLSHGADVNVRNNFGWTPLHIAAYWGNTVVASLLLSHGADVNAESTNKWGNYPARSTPLDVVIISAVGIAGAFPAGYSEDFLRNNSQIYSLIWSHGGQCNTACGLLREP